MAQEIPAGIVMEPVFIIEATYGPDAAELRPAHRPTHLARIAALRAAGTGLGGAARPPLRPGRPAGRGPGLMRRARRDGLGRSVLLTACVGVLLAFAAAGCGASDGATPTAAAAPPGSAAPSDSTAPSSDATAPPTGAFTFDLPAGWVAVPVSGSHDALPARLRVENPVFADSLAARLGALSDTTTYVAFDASADAVRRGDIVMLVVTEVALPGDTTLEAFASTIKRQVELLVESTVELRQVVVTAGQAFSLAFLAPVTRPDGKLASAAVTQVLYVLPGRAYVMTFAAPPERANDYAQAIADIATSFTIRP